LGHFKFLAKICIAEIFPSQGKAHHGYQLHQWQICRVNYTGGRFATNINDTGAKFATGTGTAGVVDTCGK
jgi:hypothetical protein